MAIQIFYDLMGRTHNVFLVFAALAFSLLLFDAAPSYSGTVQFVRIGLILMAPVLLGSLLLHGKPERQVSVLKTVRMAIALLLAVYYYSLWSTGVFTEWSDSEGRFWGFIAARFSPMLGYLFLSLSVRTLTRNLKLLSQVDRLRD